jgi:hypothetical protein
LIRMKNRSFIVYCRIWQNQSPQIPAFLYPDQLSMQMSKRTQGKFAAMPLFMTYFYISRT